MLEASSRGVEEQQAWRIKWQEALGYFSIAQMLYGLALETAFKAYILCHHPEEIELKMIADGTGNIHTVEIKQFGTPLGSGHDLERLAEKAGVFARSEN